MWYMYACSVIMLIPFFKFAEITWYNPDKILWVFVPGKHDSFVRQVYIIFVLYVIPAVLVSLPITLSFIEGWQFQRGGIAPTKGIVTVVLGMIGGLMVLTVTVISAVRLRQPGFWSVGVVLLSMASAICIVTATANQLVFIKSSGAGSVDLRLFEEAGITPVKDIRDQNCNNGRILMYLHQNDTQAVYRCPTLFVFNSYSAYPFIPWPDYIEGRSADLATAVNELERKAIPIGQSNIDESKK